MTVLILMGSCQELEEKPLVHEESLDAKFDRIRFLGAVSKASLEYDEGLRNPIKNLNFRTIYDSDVVIHDYINNIASRLNTQDNYFKTIPETSWNNTYNGQTFTNEAQLDKSTLSPRIRAHIDQYENAINIVADRFENGLLTESQLKNELKTICKNRGNSIKSDGSISMADREDIAEIFFVMDDMTDDLMLVLQDPTFENASFIKRLGRALGRVLLVAAVTAVIYFTGGVAASILKVGSLHSGIFKAGLTAVSKSTKLASGGKLYSGLMMGLGKGTIQAVGRWDEEWEGIGKEAKYGIKLAW
jgi:hypothetical protein